MDDRFETFTVLINRISRNIRRIKNNEMAEYGLRSAHISCLYYLSLTDGLTATELCERCEEDKATISRALLFLEHEGYLTCESRSVKRYRSPLRLTEKGRAVGQQITDKVSHVLAAVGAALTDAERAGFYHNLSRISDGLDAILQDNRGTESGEPV